jgi:serine/threonine-protein kinase
VLKGKFAYMSPEQYRGEELDGRADVFSLGVCLYELATGEPLFARDSEYETVAAIVLEQSVPSMRDVRTELPEELDLVAQRALAKDREARFATAEDMQHALDTFLVQGRHVVRDSHVAGMLKSLFADRIDGPELDRTPVSFGRGVPADSLSATERADLSAHLDEVEGALETAGRRKRLAVGLAAALLVLVTVAAVSLMALRDRPAASHPAPDGETAAPR